VANVAQRTSIGPGERAPDFVLPRGNGGSARFYAFVGGAPAVVVFSGDGGEAASSPVVDRLRTTLEEDVQLHHVVRGIELGSASAFHDAEGALHEAYGIGSVTPSVVVLDPNVRVASTHDVHGVDATIAAVADRVASVRHGDASPIASRHAPVLLTPDVLDADWRARLIDVWGSGGTRSTGVEMTAEGERGEQADTLRKRRRDHIIEDPELLRALTQHLGRRIMPEALKAFAFEARGFEGFKIGCYEDTDEGFFKPHRDNISTSTAHRRFALTLNLNDDYEGGELRFPEYGSARYRPDAGEALVFSGSHLHEVLPVTNGRRFVLLSFLLGARGASPR
jgi:predicted 2-oxoglutarate/Fe(II)-dependent dioxygenase YbiX